MATTADILGGLALEAGALELALLDAVDAARERCEGTFGFFRDEACLASADRVERYVTDVLAQRTSAVISAAQGLVPALGAVEQLATAVDSGRKLLAALTTFDNAYSLGQLATHVWQLARDIAASLREVGAAVAGGGWIGWVVGALAVGGTVLVVTRRR